MKITDVINKGGHSLSFEVFPPKNDASFESISSATEKIAALSPSFMSVTYGAGGGTSRYTLDIARNIQDKYEVPTLAHLSCISSTKETVAERIADMAAAGIENVMALRGDIPDGAENLPRDYRYALELVRDLRESGHGFCIGGACYPEVHPESLSEQHDMMHLKEKADAGLDFLTTQMFFDNSLFYKFRERAVKEGISLPIIPGVMPITSASQIERAQKLSGCYMPRRFLSLVESFGSDAVAMKQAGIIYATDQIIDLFANGVSNVHVYTMNKPEVAEAIMKNLSGILS